MSFYWPLLSYTWAEEECNLLSELYPSTLVTTTAPDLCNNNIDMDDPTNIDALQLVGARSSGNEDYQGLMPLFDSINHAQWGYGNTAIMGDKDVDFIIYATQHINQKQQLFTTYGENSFYSLFLGYGFFSPYPRSWVFEEEIPQKDTLLIQPTPRQVTFLILE